MLRTALILVLGATILASDAVAADRSGYDRLVADMDAALAAGADVFAPKTWEKAVKAFEKARKDVAENKKQRTLDEHVAEAAEYTANAVKAAEVGKLSLQEYLEPRDKARAAGLEDDPMYQSRLNEFRKTRLINMHRANLAREMEPSEEELEQYYNDNRGRIVQVEMRKVQEVLLANREEADAVIRKLNAGEVSMFQAASRYSIAPGAKQHLGEVGWVAEGRAQPALNEVIFALQPGEISEPVESTEGWHLFKVLDVTDAKFDDLRDEETRRLTRRRYIHDQLNAYVTDLRKNAFDVEVYENNIVRLAQMEADMVAKLAEEAAKPGSKTEQRLEELNKLIGEGAPVSSQ